MIKNDANKCAKQVEIVKTAVAAPTTVRSAVTERTIQSSNQRAATKANAESDDSETSKPLSKIDIIKKFDSKYKSNADAVDNKQSQRVSHEDNQKYAQNFDEIENDENIQNSNNDEVLPIRTRSSELDAAANNNYKNGNTQAAGGNGNGNGNGNDNSEIIPPKPLPRTSRNNSVSSLSSELGFSAAIEESSRPVAKPRTTTSYKVQLNFTHKKKNTLNHFYRLVLHRFRSVCAF